jgi:ABC-type spermidine/putrescine transport system permease subunit II
MRMDAGLDLAAASARAFRRITLPYGRKAFA